MGNMTRFVSVALLLLYLTLVTANVTGEEDEPEEEEDDYSRCTHRPQRGPCKGHLYRYYFNPWKGKCRLFIYGGCGGNSNNFRHRYACMKTCMKVVTAQICRLPPQQGNCQSYSLRYYYDSETGSCRLFFYTGCGGNRNNFRSSNECRLNCQGKRSIRRK